MVMAPYNNFAAEINQAKQNGFVPPPPPFQMNPSFDDEATAVRSYK